MPVVVGLAGLVAWEAGVRNGRIMPLLFPAPSSIATTTLGSLASGPLLKDLAATLARVTLGLALGGAAGVLLGFAMGWWRPLRAALDPVVAAVYAIPKIAVLPLLLIFFGVGELPRVIVA
ncbi:MAG: ABC transporter permease, partial [Chloroflexota bacterium]|nr:ABC transporter permease [Chloroflexota bacterium]